jgi:hypothetical protein
MPTRLLILQLFLASVVATRETMLLERARAKRQTSIAAASVLANSGHRKAK